MPCDDLLLVAVELLAAVQMCAPIQPYRLAYYRGFTVLEVQGPVLVTLLHAQRVIVINGWESLRQREGAIARAIALAELQRRGMSTDTSSVNRLARLIVLPPDQLALDLRSARGQLKQIAREHPFAPEEWIADAVEEILSAPRAKVLEINTRRSSRRARVRSVRLSPRT